MDKPASKRIDGRLGIVTTVTSVETDSTIGITNMKCSNIDVVKVQVLNDYNLHLTFDDGVSGDVDISKLVSFRGIFERLKDRNFFLK